MNQQNYEIPARSEGVYVVRASSREEAAEIAREIEHLGWEPLPKRSARS